MTERAFKLVGITQRCTPDSYNFMALKTLGELMQPEMSLETVDIQDIGFYDPGMENGAIPNCVAELAKKISNSDGLVIWTPEYNHSLPARLKNCLDWLSRIKPNPLLNRATLIGSSTTGHLGGARVQYELRRVLDSQQANILIKPEVFIGNAKTKFNAQGDCVDDETKQVLRQQIAGFKNLMLRSQKMNAL